MCDPIIAGGLALAGTLLSKPSLPKPAPAPSGPVDQSAVNARDLLRRRMTSAFGRQSTIRTGAMGPPSLGKPSLLGGS